MTKERLEQGGGMDSDNRGVEGDRHLGEPVGLLRSLVNSKVAKVLTGLTLATGVGVTGYVAYKAPAIETRFELNLKAELKQVLSDYADLLNRLFYFAGQLGLNNDVGLLKNAENLVIGANALYNGVKKDIADLKVCYEKLSAAEGITLQSFRQIEGTPLGDCLTLDQLFARLKGLNLTAENRVALQEIIAQNDKLRGKLSELTTTEFWSAAGWKAAKQELFGIDTNTDWINDQPNAPSHNAPVPVPVDLMPAKPSQKRPAERSVEPARVKEPEPVIPKVPADYGAEDDR